MTTRQGIFECLTQLGVRWNEGRYTTIHCQHVLATTRRDRQFAHFIAIIVHKAMFLARKTQDVFVDYRRSEIGDDWRRTAILDLERSITCRDRK